MVVSMDLKGQLSLREKPDRRAVMQQRWENLLFLHWEVNPELIQATLPAGLEVDTFQGKTYLGLVPFFMRGVRFSCLPALPGISEFMECNLRTYVTGPAGPGVWFYSLDCNQTLAVELARRFFHLPYFHAEMSVEQEEGGWMRYQTRRLYRASLRSKERTSSFRYRGTGEKGAVSEETLDFFLVERYLLYSMSRRGKLYSGRVWHQPYQVSPAEVTEMDDGLIDVAGFKPPNAPALYQHYSPGVDVSVFQLKRC